MTSYKFTVSPGGQYMVTLRFAEFSTTAAGKRVMKITINGVDQGSRSGYPQLVGKAVADHKQYTTTAGSDGLITIAFTKVSGPESDGLGHPGGDRRANADVTQATRTPTATATPCVTCPTNTPTATPTVTREYAARDGGTEHKPTVTPAPLVRRFNSGSTTFTDSLAQVWTGDTMYATGGSGYVLGSTAKSNTAVANTVDNTLFQKFRTAMTAYKFTVPNGTYRCGCASPSFGGSGRGP